MLCCACVCSSGAAAARPMTTTHAASLDRQPSANLTEDGDLFKGTDKQRTGIKEPVPGTKKVRGHCVPPCLLAHAGQV